MNRFLWNSVRWIVLAGLVLFLPAHLKASELVFSVYPYLQNVTAESIVVQCRFGSDYLRVARVEYVRADQFTGNLYPELVDLTQSTNDPSGEGDHVNYVRYAKLTGLSAGTLYHYRVCDSTQCSADSTFQTAPLNKASVTFLMWSDHRQPHPATPNNPNHEKLVQVVSDYSFEFILDSGDFIYSGSEIFEPYLWAGFFSAEKDLLRQIPMFPSPGNHENITLTGELRTYRWYTDVPTDGVEVQNDFGKYYTFKYNNIRLISLNINKNLGEDTYSFMPGTPQYQFLVNQLASHNTDPCTAGPLFVMIHLPPFSSSDPSTGHSEDDDVIAARENLVSVYQQYGVDLVFSGHDQRLERSKKIWYQGEDQPLVYNGFRGVTYIISGGGGEPMEGKSSIATDFSAYNTVNYGFTLVTVTGNKISLEIYRVKNADDDSWDLSDNLLVEKVDSLENIDALENNGCPDWPFTDAGADADAGNEWGDASPFDLNIDAGQSDEDTDTFVELESEGGGCNISITPPSLNGLLQIALWGTFLLLLLGFFRKSKA